jgi:hypothetical protein
VKLQDLEVGKAYVLVSHTSGTVLHGPYIFLGQYTSNIAFARACKEYRATNLAHCTAIGLVYGRVVFSKGGKWSVEEFEKNWNIAESDLSPESRNSGAMTLTLSR